MTKWVLIPAADSSNVNTTVFEEKILKKFFLKSPAQQFLYS